MAETLVSPGVLARENDLSFVSQQPVAVGAAIIGPTVKGPVEVPTIVTSYSDYSSLFGTTFDSGSDEYSFFTSIAAYNYFQNGGESLLVARVVSGSYSSASTTGNQAPSGSNTSGSFILQTLGEGVIMNSSSSLDSSGSLASGSSDNIRWEISNPSTSSGTFDLLIRRGDDNTNNKIILETWTNLSLDPKADNYISKVIGDQVESYNVATNQVTITGDYRNASRYVRVSSVPGATLNYFDNNGVAKTSLTGFIPAASSGSFTGATGDVKAGANFYNNINSSNTQGLEGGNYTNMISLLANQDDYVFNVLLTPGLYNADYTAQCTSMINNTQTRGDSLFVLDLVAFSSNVTAVTSEAASRNTSYAASYWPWVQVIDPDLGRQVWVPASTVIGGVYAYNDSVSEPWFAPAGINRGGLGQVVRAEQKLNSTNRDTLYWNKVNPIASFPATGVVVYGQKTLQTRASALDRVNVRRLLIELKGYISQVADNLVFEQNTIATRNAFLSAVNPYLEGVQQRQGLYAFKVIMDESNNTADVIDRNQMVGQIYIQPTKTAEFIYLDFQHLTNWSYFPSVIFKKLNIYNRKNNINGSIRFQRNFLHRLRTKGTE
jgi:phage tail sheath protein FI